MAHLIEALRCPKSGGSGFDLYVALRLEVPGSIPFRVLGNVQSTYSFCPFSVELESTRPLTEGVPRNFLQGKVQPERGADIFAVLVVSNVKIRRKAQHFPPPPPPFPESS